MTIESNQLKQIIEGALLAAGQPLDIKRLQELVTPEDCLPDDAQVSKEDIQAALEAIVEDCQRRGFELREVGSGWRFQVREETAQWVNRLWEEKPQKYSRAMLETLALIAYRQPITRGDIEEIRGVAVSSHIIKTLAERDWVKVVGHRDVPGRPSLYATTRTFLDYFNLSSLEELPSLGELADLDELNSELNLEQGGEPAKAVESSTDGDGDIDGESAVNSEQEAQLTVDESAGGASSEYAEGDDSATTDDDSPAPLVGDESDDDLAVTNPDQHEVELDADQQALPSDEVDSDSDDSDDDGLPSAAGAEVELESSDEPESAENEHSDDEITSNSTSLFDRS